MRCLRSDAQFERRQIMSRKIARLEITAAALLGVAPMAMAAGLADVGTLNTVHFLANGVVVAYTSGARSGAPACATATDRFAIDIATAGGKSQLAGLLMAYASGRPVVIHGTVNCNVWGDTETIDYFYTVD